MTLGERLQRERKKRGLSQDQLAELVGVTRQAVSKWERDEAMPELDKAVRMGEVLELSLDELLRGEERSDAAEVAGAVPGAAAAPGLSTVQGAAAAPDFLTRLLACFKRRWYLVGYGIAALGLLDLARLVMAKSVLSQWNSVVTELPGVFEGMPKGMSAVITGQSSSIFLMLGLWGSVKIAGGLAVLFWGGRYCKRQAQPQSGG